MLFCGKLPGSSSDKRVGTPRTEVLVGGAELGSAAILETGTGVGGALDRATVTVTVITEIGEAVVAAAAMWKYLEGSPWDRYIKERKAMSSVHLKIDTITRPKARNKFWEEIPKHAHYLRKLFVHLDPR